MDDGKFYNGQRMSDFRITLCNIIQTGYFGLTIESIFSSHITSTRAHGKKLEENCIMNVTKIDEKLAA